MNKVLGDFRLDVSRNDGTLTQKEKILISEKIAHIILPDVKNVLEDFDEMTQFQIIGNIGQLLANSLDANSTKLRIRTKFDDKTNELIFSLGDNGDGSNSKTTNEKGKNDLGGEGIGIEMAVKSSSGFKLIRNENGAVVTIKMNIRYMEQFMFKNGLLDEYKKGNISTDELKAHLNITFAEMIKKTEEDVLEGNLNLSQVKKIMSEFSNFQL